MKRKLAWLTLPILLSALLYGLKYRSDHPPLTKTDLEIRALLSKPAKPMFYHSTYSPTGMANHQSFELKNVGPFVDSLILAPQSSQQRPKNVSDVVSFHWNFAKPSSSGITAATTFLYVRERRGILRIYRSEAQTEYPIHPATVKRWRQLLRENPDIGQQLRSLN